MFKIYKKNIHESIIVFYSHLNCNWRGWLADLVMWQTEPLYSGRLYERGVYFCMHVVHFDILWHACASSRCLSEPLSNSRSFSKSWILQHCSTTEVSLWGWLDVGPPSVGGGPTSHQPAFRTGSLRTCPLRTAERPVSQIFSGQIESQFPPAPLIFAIGFVQRGSVSRRAHRPAPRRARPLTIYLTKGNLAFRAPSPTARFALIYIILKHILRTALHLYQLCTQFSFKTSNSNWSIFNELTADIYRVRMFIFLDAKTTSV